MVTGASCEKSLRQNLFQCGERARGVKGIKYKNRAEIVAELLSDGDPRKRLTSTYPKPLPR